MSATWWIRQARALADPAGPVAARVLLERDAGTRVKRLRSAVVDASQQRRRPSREKMRALVLRPGGSLVWRSVPTPGPPAPGAAVVRPLAMATCDMDRPIALGATPFLAPMRFGHECVAEVLATGADVSTVRPGQRVVVPFQINCGGCIACRAGNTANCSTVPPISMYGFGIGGGHWGGAIADELAVPYADAMLVPLPAGIEPASAASVADNVTDGYRHIGPHLSGMLEQNPETRVVIVGGMAPRHLFTASVPLYVGLIAKALGAEDVVLVDARRAIRHEAHRLGFAAVTPDKAAKLPPAPLVADISATPAGLRLAIALTAADGVCSSSGSLHATSRVPSALMFGRNVSLFIGRTHARAHIPDVLDLMATGRLRPETVTTAVASFDEAPRALAEHMQGRSTKTVLTAV